MRVIGIIPAPAGDMATDAASSYGEPARRPSVPFPFPRAGPADDILVDSQPLPRTPSANGP